MSGREAAKYHADSGILHVLRKRRHHIYDRICHLVNHPPCKAVLILSLLSSITSCLRRAQMDVTRCLSFALMTLTTATVGRFTLKYETRIRASRRDKPRSCKTLHTLTFSYMTVGQRSCKTLAVLTLATGWSDTRSRYDGTRSRLHAELLLTCSTP